MDNPLLIVIGVSLLLAGAILIPAELQIYKSRVDQADQPYARRHHNWSQKLLNHLLTLGFSFLVLYVVFAESSILDSLLRALSLK